VPPEKTMTLSPVPSPITSVTTISTPQPVNDDAVAAANSPEALIPVNNGASADTNHPEILNVSRNDVSGMEEEIVDDSVDLIPPNIITPIYVKSCSRRNFASKLVTKLFDDETRLRSNVKGRGKDKLDPDKIKYVKSKAFEYFPLSGGEKEATEWQLCIISIDESNRRLKKKSIKKEPLNET